MISFGITNTELNKTKRNHNSKKIYLLITKLVLNHRLNMIYCKYSKTKNSSGGKN